MIVYGHFVETAQAFARSVGIGGRWVDRDWLGHAAYAAEVLEAAADPAWRCILHHEWLEWRLTDGRAFAQWVTPGLEWLRTTGLQDRVSAVQFSDEFWSRLAHFGHPQYHDGWPSFRGRTHAACWAERGRLAALWGQRMHEYRALWRAILGTACPMIGTAETGGVVPPTFETQEWWGLNVYPGSRGEAPRRAVQSIYAQAWAFTSLPILPVIPTYTGPGSLPVDQIPTVVDLGLTYAAPFQIGHARYPAIIDHPQTWAVGVFCVRWPGEYERAHGDGIGLTRLDASYAEGVRWLAAHLQAR